MSKSLKKLIDINRLREFKNKLVGTGSAYVQTAAVDQTIAGTKTFSKPIVGSVTGSSGSCTGNAVTATNATYANWLRTSSHSDHLFHTEWDNAGYFWTYVTAGDGGYRAVRVARSDSAATAEACTGNAATATTAANGVDSAGGDWIRFKNGIQICTGTSSSISLAPNEIKSTFATFPKSFSTVLNVIVCATNPHVIASTWGISTTGCEVSLKNTSPGDNNIFGRYIAFGTWK